jgi:hypothetical protein
VRSHLVIVTAGASSYSFTLPPGPHLVLFYHTKEMFYSKFQSWCLQRVANLSLVALLCLMFLAFRPAPKGENDTTDDSRKPGRGRNHQYRPQITNSQLALVYYTILIHALGLIFPVRLCWAIRSTIKDLKFAQIRKVTLRRPTSKAHFRTIERGLGYEDSITSDCSESEIELATESSFTTDSEYEDELLVHAIILPNYKEEMETLRETLEGLASHQLARSSYEVSGRNPIKVSRKSFTEPRNCRSIWRWKTVKLEPLQKRELLSKNSRNYSD